MNADGPRSMGGALPPGRWNKLVKLYKSISEDQGRGIEPDLLEKIFEPGFTTKAGSPGLGLSVCKKVVEQHGGSIRVASQLQQGSTFTIFMAASGGIQ